MITLQVSIDSKEAERMINNLHIKVPIEAGNAAYEFCKQVETELVVGAAKNIHTGKLITSIRAERQTRMRSVVKMKKTGIYLDRMKPHPVWLKKGRLITQWAKEHNYKGFIMWNLSKLTGQIERGIWVKPHPFIDDAYARAFSRFDIILRNYVGKAIVASK